ncbi:MAG: energy transducer TonB [Betaproteobacteria bacterium]|nr:energy transducer TonB [Betaproteobacteria bacterium]
MRTAAAAVAGAGILAVAVPWMVSALRDLWGSGDPAPRRIVQVTLTRPPPPPPVPREEVPKPAVRDEVKLAEPEPSTPREKSPESPPDRPLGLDAQGDGGNDGFGLAARPGGRDIVLGQGGGGRGGGEWDAFLARIQDHFNRELAKNERLRRSSYRVVVRLWFDPDGRVARSVLDEGADDPAMNAELSSQLGRMSLPERTLPMGMEQPLRIRITSQAVGRSSRD